MKKGKIIFWALITIEVALAITDGILTRIGTPDLSLEANPLVAYLGLGWSALFAANIIRIGLFAFAVYYAFIKYQPPLIPYITYKEYSSMLFFNRPDKFKWMFYKLPKNWKPLLALLGFSAGITLPAARIVLVFDGYCTLLIRHLKGFTIPLELFFP